MYSLEIILPSTYTYITHFGKISWFQVVAFKIYGHFCIPYQPFFRRPQCCIIFVSALKGLVLKGP